MLVVVAVPSSSVGSCRAQMAKLVNEPPRKGGAIHFKKELDVIRSKAYRLIALMPIQCITIRIPTNVDAISARELAVNQVAKLALERQPQRVVFELDEAAIKNDRRWLRTALPPGSGIEYQHLGKSADPMLWVADGIAWAIHRGGKWRAMVQHLITEETLL